MERIAKVREAVKEGWTVGHDVAYEMPWNTWMKMMFENYCSRREKKKLETELWNLVVKDKVERYTSGLPDSIQGSKLRTKGEGMTIQETTILNNNLIKKNVTRDDNSRNNSSPRAYSPPDQSPTN
nr:hypothetical protein [Tanacetum cinerariifolium]